MPSRLPAASNRTPVSRAACAAEPLDLSIGTWPAALKNCRLNHPRRPGVVKYSRLARNVTRRRTTRGRKKGAAPGGFFAGREAPAAAWEMLGAIDLRLAGQAHQGTQ